MEEIKILLVEDCQEVALKFRYELENAGYTVNTADSGNSAIESISVAEPDLILMDVLLKGDMDGIEASDIIKQKYDIPIIILTASMNETIMQEAIASKADYYLPKSASFKEINTAILMAIKKFRDKIVQDTIIKDKLSRSVILAETNMRIILVMQALDKIREEENRLYKNNDITSFYRIIVDELMRLTEAKFGALALFNKNGKLDEFITMGMTDEQKNKIGKMPTGKGLLAHVFTSDEIVRLNDIKSHGKYVALPEHHPDIKSLLGSSIIVNGERRAAIYLANKKHSENNYNDSDELVLSLLIPEIQHTLERHDLLNMLNIERLTLRHQRDSQQRLIKKISKMRDQLVQSEKMASIGQLAAGVAHEINNPIGYIGSNFSTLKNYINGILDVLEVYESNQDLLLARPGVESSLSKIKNKIDMEYIKEDILDLLSESNEGIDRVKKIVQDLKDFSHVDEYEWQLANINQGINSTLNIVNNEIKYKAKIKKELGDIPDIECIASQLNQVFMNLFVNAAHSIEESGIIRIKTGMLDEQWVYVEVEDNGSGIKEENLKNIFNPFFTTKPVGKGTGLGLSLSYSIIQKHHGKIEVKSKQGVGTKFIVSLPIHQLEEKAASDIKNGTN